MSSKFGCDSCATDAQSQNAGSNPQRALHSLCAVGWSDVQRDVAESRRMSKYRDSARRYHERIRAILLKEWDPIGVADVPQARDEYDSYVGQIYAMLIRHEARHALVDHLWQVETVHMGPGPEGDVNGDHDAWRIPRVIMRPALQGLRLEPALVTPAR